jgi:Na+/H+ antiporter NhaD/arsenite permease-like protein
LLSIALFPLLAPRFWHKHFGKVSAFWAIVFALPFLVVFKEEAFEEILHIYIIDYIPFIILLASLFTVSGGIYIRGTLRGTPLVNTLLIGIGTLLASWIGTTGASMIMIRPLLRANRERTHKVHTIIFFIFLVSNIGGSLTPLGDPPLFLGFLHNVPFFWTFSLMPHLLVTSILLLIIYFSIELHYHKKEELIFGIEDKQKLGIEGGHNVLFLIGIIAAVLMSGSLELGEFTIFGIHLGLQNILRDFLIILMGIFSLVFTRKKVREENEFSWFPIKEVAILFAGIFMTIIPALAILKAGENGALAFLIKTVEKPHHYFWITGALSSFLDNAPTYLTFFNSALGQFFSGIPESEAVAQLLATKAIYLQSISCGAVFFGAMSYIGNAPNFMVKSIAEEYKIMMPSFFGYMLKYSLPILIPVFILISLLFF